MSIYCPAVRDSRDCTGPRSIAALGLGASPHHYGHRPRCGEHGQNRGSDRVQTRIGRSDPRVQRPWSYVRLK